VVDDFKNSNHKVITSNYFNELIFYTIQLLKGRTKNVAITCNYQYIN